MGNNVNAISYPKQAFLFLFNMITAAKKILCVLTICVAFFACKNNPTVKEIPVNDFFKTQDRTIYRLSPDGKNLSYLQLEGKKQVLVVENLSSGNITSVTKQDDGNILFYTWVSNDNLICYKENDLNRSNPDLYLVDRLAASEKLLSGSGQSRIRLLEDQLIENKFLLVTCNRRDSTVFDVYRLNVLDGNMNMVAQNPGNFTSWLTDANGKLRVAIATDGVDESLWFRETEDKQFKKIITNNFKNKISPIAFSDENLNTIYAISNINRDKNALVEIDGKTGLEQRVLFQNDSLNVVDAEFSKAKGKMEFVVYETWKKNKHYLDEETKARYKNLDELLANEEFRLVHKDKDEKHLIVRTFSDRNPGSYYLYYTETNQLRKLSDINPSINEQDMCEMKPIAYTTKDGFRINGYLTLPKGVEAKKLPVVVMPHNGPGQRNSWGYNADVQFLANRGYAVLQVNYRGSTGYGKAFYAAGFKEWGANIQRDVDEGVEWLIKQNIADPKRIAIFGNGFGGFIAINAAIANPSLYSCAGSTAGVLNLFSYLKSIPPFLTSNLQMFYEIVGNPDTDAEYMRLASPIFHADRVKLPIFITQNAKDKRINGNDALQFVKELKKQNISVTYVEKGEQKTLADRDLARTKSYTALEKFLKENIKKH